MSSSPYRIRRATLDDLGALRPLWDSLRLPVADLEKRLTEFQVAEGSDGQVIGAIGFLMTRRQGQIHSEVFSDFAVADIVRPLFWARLQILATNHGIMRVWTREQAPFWKHNGLQPAAAETLKNLPPEWNAATEAWLTLQLKNEEALVSIEKEVAVLMLTEKQRTAKAVERAKTLKTTFTIVAFLIAFLVIAVGIYAYVKYKQAGLPNP